MKKFKLLMTPLLVLPFVIGCNNGGGDKPGEVKFSLLSDQPIMVDGKVATVNVDWTPNDIIKFESFTFDATPTKGNTVTFDPTGDPRPMRVTITFTEDITEDISGTLSFKYEDVTAKSKGESSINVTIPKPEVDPTLTKEEFDNAVSFKDVQYVQKSVSNGADPVLIEELSPTVFHSLNEYDSYYAENFVKKDGSDYEKANRMVKGGTYTFEEAEESDFVTPQSDLFSVAFKLYHVGLSYSSFTYDSKTGTYSASFTPEGSETKSTIILKFENKKLISEADVEGDGTTQSITYTYLEKTPEYPDSPGPFDVIELPKLGGYQDNVTLNAQNGKIYIKATNATEALSSDDWLNITCKLKGEFQSSDSRVFSGVDITIDGEKVTSTYGTATGPLQYWYVDIESKKPTQDDLYIILTLNEEFVSESGRIMKPNYTGEVSCELWNLDASNKQEQIQIDYYSITKTAS